MLTFLMMTWITKRNTTAGFTLVELLVVMGIIGVLATLLFSNFSGARERARDTKRKNDLVQLKKALRLYYTDEQSYPSDAGGAINGCGAAADEECEWGQEAFVAGSAIYMNQVPQDPIHDVNTGLPTYEYELGSPLVAPPTTDAFTLRATLENESDQDISKSQAACGVDIANDLEANIYMVCSE